MKKRSVSIGLIILVLVLLVITLTNISNEENKINNTKITGKAISMVCMGSHELSCSVSDQELCMDGSECRECYDGTREQMSDDYDDVTICETYCGCLWDEVTGCSNPIKCKSLTKEQCENEESCFWGGCPEGCSWNGTNCEPRECSSYSFVNCPTNEGCSLECPEGTIEKGGQCYESLGEIELNIVPSEKELTIGEVFNLSFEINCTYVEGCKNIYLESIGNSVLGNELILISDSLVYENIEGNIGEFNISQNSIGKIIISFNASNEIENGNLTIGIYSNDDDLLDSDIFYFNISPNEQTDVQDEQTQQTTSVEENITLDLIYPEGDLEIYQNQDFNITLNLTCGEYDCGEINISLYHINDSEEIEIERKTKNLNATNYTEIIFEINTSGKKIGDVYDYGVVAESNVGNSSIDEFEVKIIKESFWWNTFSISSTEFKTGSSKDLTERERIEVEIKNETHHIGIIEIGEDWAVINISSTPQQANLSLGETKSFDIDGDYVKDVNVTLQSIDNSTNESSIKIKEIPEPQLDLQPKDDKTADDSQEDKDNAPDYDYNDVDKNDSQGSTEEAKTKEKSSAWIWIILVIILVLIGGIVAIVFLMKQGSPKESSEESSGGQGNGEGPSNPPQEKKEKPVQVPEIKETQKQTPQKQVPQQPRTQVQQKRQPQKQVPQQPRRNPQKRQPQYQNPANNQRRTQQRQPRRNPQGYQ